MVFGERIYGGLVTSWVEGYGLKINAFLLIKSKV